MKENIPALIAFCNRSILAWYRKEFPKDIDHFTPVDKNNEEVIDIIHDMYIIVKPYTKVQMLMPVIKYYFAVAVVEYYVLECRCPLFTGVITKQMIDFSMNANLSTYRQKMMGFNHKPFRTLNIKTPYKFDFPVKKTKSIRL
jgi:hypothetical protein